MLGDVSATLKRRISDERVEAGVLTGEDLREFEEPVERRERVVSRPKQLRLCVVDRQTGAQRLPEGLERFDSLRFAGFIFLSAEERGDQEVSCRSHESRRCLSLAEEPLLPVDIVGVGERADLRALLLGVGESGGETLRQFQHALARLRPVEVNDLIARESDERVAVAQGVIEERERMVLRQRRQPERELCQVDGKLVTVDSVEARLRDAPPRVENDVFVGRDGRDAALDLPGAHEGVAKEAA